MYSRRAESIAPNLLVTVVNLRIDRIAADRMVTSKVGIRRNYREIGGRKFGRDGFVNEPEIAGFSKSG